MSDSIESDSKDNTTPMTLGGELCKILGLRHCKSLTIVCEVGRPPMVYAKIILKDPSAVVAVKKTIQKYRLETIDNA